MACAQIFQFLEERSPTLYKAAFSLAIANSGMNPIIYAWKNSTFRRAFNCLLHCKSPDYHHVINIEMTRTICHRRSSTVEQSSLNEQSLPSIVIKNNHLHDLHEQRQTKIISFDTLTSNSINETTKPLPFIDIPITTNATDKTILYTPNNIESTNIFNNNNFSIMMNNCVNNSIDQNGSIIVNSCALAEELQQK